MQNIEERIKELKDKANTLGEERKVISQKLDENAFELLKTSGAIEELTKLLDNNKEGDKK